MSVGAPVMLGLAVLAAPVVALYVLKVRRRPVLVPYLWLWEQLVAETRARALFRRLKRLYSLLLQLLILGSLVLAVARPDLGLGAREKDSIVLLLDVSASMSTVEPGAPDRTRFELMLERASALVEGRSGEDEMLLATVSDRVEVLCSFSRNKVGLREALRRAAPTSRSLDAGAALAFARDVTAGRARPAVLFLSDGDAGEVPAAIRALAAEGWGAARHLAVGAARENAGILRFTARKNEGLGTDHLLAVLVHHGDAARETRLELSRDGRVIAVEPVTLPPGEEVTWSRALALPEGGSLRLALDGDDALPLDDEAFAVVRPLRLRKVGLVVAEEDQAAPFVVAFQSMVEVVAGTSFYTTPGRYASMTEERREADVTICLGVLPEGLPRTGNLILMDTPLPDDVPARELGRDASPVVWDWDREHLLNRFLNYRDLPLPPARVLQLEAGEELVTGLEGPLVSAFDLPDRRVVYVGFDMTAELFPFRLAFPLLLRNALAWFEVEEEVLLEPTYAPGATITPLRRVPAGEARVTFLRDGAPVERALELRGGRFHFTETDSSGAYVFQLGGRNFPTAVNLFDGSESAVVPVADPVSESGQEDAPRSLLGGDLWAALAALALALWTLEWVTYHRRLTE